ncbi:MAG: hypothetical protein J5379_02550 [Clostridiales bacterium]|nr:hypothetical protein [Clostridiales bacterium]
MSGKIMMRVVSMGLAGVLGVSAFSMVMGTKKVNATPYKSIDNTELGVKGMAKPVTPDAYEDNYWKGSYVSYGDYNDAPIIFRVLDPETTIFGGRTMFLDCNNILYKSTFSKTGTDEDNLNDWSYSKIREELNDTAFLSEVFTPMEQNAIWQSSISGHELSVGTANGQVDSIYKDIFENYVGLSGDKLFLLDVEEAHNPAYGYRHSTSYMQCSERIKYNSGSEYTASYGETDHGCATWWLRSGSALSTEIVGMITVAGDVAPNDSDFDFGVSPAMNIDLSKVLFSTAIEGWYGEVGTLYSLTLILPILTYQYEPSSDFIVSGRNVSVPVTIHSTEADSLNALVYFITDKEYTDPDASLLYYSTVDDITDLGENKIIENFEIPSSLDQSRWGVDYHVYVTAELRCEEGKTDFSSEPFELVFSGPTITKAEPTDNGVQIRWSSVNGFTRYNVYRSDSKNGTYSYLASVTDGSYKYVDKTAQGGKTYYYKVRPYSKSGGITTNGDWSEAKKVTILPDTKLTAEPKSGVTMRLSWTEVSGAGSYEIYRATSASGPYTYVKATTGTSTSDTGLKAGTRYYYMIRAKKTVSGETSYSKYASSVAVALATPTLESATFKSGKGVTLTWTKASGADRYNVYRYNTSTGKYDYVASVLGGTLTYTDPNGKKGDYYKVRAYKRVDGVVYYGGWSNAKAGK